MEGNGNNTILSNYTNENIQSIISEVSSTFTVESKDKNISINLMEEFTYLGFFIGFVLMLLINLGPYFYYRFVKNKKIFRAASIEPKHTI